LTFLKKYLHFAKARYRPVLKPEAAEFIMNFYAELRNKEDTKVCFRKYCVHKRITIKKF